MTAFKAVAGVLGGVCLLTTSAVTFRLRAKDDSAALAAAHQKLQAACCVCFNTFAARRAALAACGALAALTLILAVASDGVSCNQSAKFGLATTALALSFIGGIVAFGLSSCGCSLCCVCAPGECNRTAQATTAVSCSVLLWLSSFSVFVWVILFLLLAYFESQFQNNPSFCGILESSSLEVAVPPGLTTIAGVLSATSLLLQGHFITLVQEALANLSSPPPPPGQGAVGTLLQAPQQANSQLDQATDLCLVVHGPDHRLRPIHVPYKGAEPACL